MSTIVDIADAVVTELNGASFSQSFTAVRMHRPVYDLKFGGLVVSVSPRSVDFSMLERNAVLQESVIDVGVQSKVADVAAAVDAMIDLVEEIADLLRFKPMAGALWSGIEINPVVHGEHLDEKRVFTSVVSVTYKNARQ